MPAKRPPSMAPTFEPNVNPARGEFDPNDPLTRGLAPGIDGAIPIDTGYDVETVSKSLPNDKDWTIVMENGYGQSFSLWAEEVETSFKLEGSFGQARHYRQFYPSAFSQPVLTVRGRMPSQYEYNRLAQFIRTSHVLALDTAEVSYQYYAANIIAGSQMFTQGTRTDSAGDALPTISLYLQPTALIDASTPAYFQHQGMVLEGYVLGIEAGAKKFEYAPEFSFDFTIASSQRTSNIGIYTDTLVTGSQIMTELAFNDNTAQEIMSFASARSAADNAAMAKQIMGTNPFGNRANQLGQLLGKILG